MLLRTRILTQSITGFVAIKVTRSLSTAAMASQVSVVVFRRRAAVMFPLDRCSFLGALGPMRDERLGAIL